MICNMFIIYSYVFVILKLNVLLYAFRAGVVVCLRTLNLRKDYEAYIGVVVFR